MNGWKELEVRKVYNRIEVSIEGTLVNRMENKKSRSFRQLAVPFLRRKWCECWETRCTFVLSETVNPTVNGPGLESKWKNRI